MVVVVEVVVGRSAFMILKTERGDLVDILVNGQGGFKNVPMNSPNETAIEGRTEKTTGRQHQRVDWP